MPGEIMYYVLWIVGGIPSSFVVHDVMRNLRDKNVFTLKNLFEELLICVVCGWIPFIMWLMYKLLDFFDSIVLKGKRE